MDPNLQSQWNNTLGDFGSGANSSGANSSLGGAQGSGGGLPWNQMGMASGIGSLGAGLLGMLFPSQNPASAAMPYLNQIGSANQYLAPWQQAGTGALSTLQGQYGNLLSNPSGVMNAIGANYHQSPGFQFALQQALQGANHGAAAGGMAGSAANQQQNMGVATQMGNQDYYNYMQNALGLYGQGLQGEQGLANTGMEAGNNMASNLAQMLSAQAQLAYAGQEGQNQNQSSNFGNIMSGIGDLAAFGGL